MRLSARVSADQFAGAFSDYYRFSEQRLENAAMLVTDRARRIATNRIREAGAAANLGRLFQAFGSTSDLARGRGVHRQGATGFSASGTVYVRSKSQRTLGAIQAYAYGAKIKPVRGRWLWFPTDEIQRRAGPKGGRIRVEPGNWERLGLDTKIGPLTFLKSINGWPLLVVKNVSVSTAGKARSARALPKSGRLRDGRTEKAFIVAFIGIPRTSRADRVDIEAIVQSVVNEVPDLLRQAIGRI